MNWWKQAKATHKALITGVSILASGVILIAFLLTAIFHRLERVIESQHETTAAVRSLIDE